MERDERKKNVENVGYKGVGWKNKDSIFLLMMIFSFVLFLVQINTVPAGTIEEDYWSWSAERHRTLLVHHEVEFQAVTFKMFRSLRNPLCASEPVALGPMPNF